MVSGHTSTGSQRFDPISWRQHSSFAWSSTYSSKLLWNVKQTNKFLKTNKYSLKHANEFRFFCRTIPIVFDWKFYRNIFVLKNPCWLILKPCNFVIPKWKQGSTLPKARSKSGAKMIQYSAIEIWSKIPPEIKNKTCLALFRAEYKKYVLLSY